MEKILSSRSVLEGERKQVTVLFCDLVSSTSIAGRIGAEAMHDLLNWFFELALAEVHRYEGTINQFLGDGFMALFGAPIAHEDHARRAVLVSLSILKRLQDQKPPLEGLGNIPIAARIGLNTGPVVVGKIGDNLRMDYTAIGETTHLAARLQALAEPGTIYMGEATQHATRDYVSYEFLGLRSLKGKPEPVPVYKVLGASHRSDASHGPAPVQIGPLVPALQWGPKAAAPFVGRQAELDTLLAWLKRMSEGRGGVVSVVGEAGIGKSRLVMEARLVSPVVGGLWLEGHGVSFGQNISYLPFIEALRGLFGITDDDDQSKGWFKLETGMARLSPETSTQWLPYLGVFLGIEIPESFSDALAQVNNEAMGRQIFAACRHLFECLAQEQSLILVLEDYQWVDQSSAQLLEHLLQVVDASPFLVLVLSRPDAASVDRLRELLIRDHPGAYAELRVGPLSTGECLRLVRHLREEDRHTSDVDRLILDKAGGNPFFVEEVVHSLRDVGPVSPATDDNRLHAKGESHQPIAIPNSIQDVIAARIDRLDGDVKRILKLASVVGRNFLYKVLDAVNKASSDLDKNLGELEHLQIVQERHRLPELEYMFKHALVQEVTYESILLQRRRQLHRTVAACIEHLFADRLEEFYGVLAHHYARAEEWEKAHQYLVRAGDQAGRMAADAEALANYEHALVAYEHAFGDRWEPLQRASLARKMGESLFRRGEFERAVEHLQHALSVLGRRALPTSRWGVRSAILVELLRQAKIRLRHWRGRSGSLGKPDAVTGERYRIYEVMAWVDFFIDQERMFLDTLVLLNIAEPNRLLVEMTQAQAGVGIGLDMISLHRIAGSYHARAIANAKQSQHPRATAYAHFGLGIHRHFFQGDLENAEGNFERAVEAYRQVGDVRGSGAAASCWLHSLCLRGDTKQWESKSEALAKIGADTGDQQVYGWGLGHLSHVRLLRGAAVDDVIRQLDTTLSIFQAIPDYASMAYSKAVVSLCYLAQGDLSTALRVATLTLSLIRERHIRGPFLPYVIGLLADCASVALSAVRRGINMKRGDEAAIQAIDRMLSAWGTITREGEVAMCRWRGVRAWANAKERKARRWWQRSLEGAEAMGATHEVAKTCLEMGRWTGERQYLARAETSFDQTGSKLELAQARALIEKIHC